MNLFLLLCLGSHWRRLPACSPSTSDGGNGTGLKNDFILVNNAAIALQGRAIDDPEIDNAAMDRQWATNVAGVVANIRAAVKVLPDGGRIMDSHCIRRFALVEEVAAAIVFLAGPDAASITGTTLDVNGGYTA